MTHEISQEQQEEVAFKLAEFLNLSSDEYLIKLMKEVSSDYAKGYLDAFLVNAKDEDIHLFYQIVRTINMV